MIFYEPLSINMKRGSNEMKKLDKKIKEAIELRKQNKSLNQISKELDVAKSSVSIWTRGIETDVNVERRRDILIREKYEKSPKKCIFCGKNLEYKKRKNKFCGTTCSGKYNHPKTKRKNCLNCNKELKYNHTTFCCFECSVENHWKEKIKKVIETGEFPSSQKSAKEICIKMRGHRCEVCGNTEWVGRPIPLVFDHIDGKNNNWKSNNLRLVCGNCDMQLPTYKSKNRGNGRRYQKEYEQRKVLENKILLKKLNDEYEKNNII